jgi:hypothetical protein
MLILEPKSWRIEPRRSVFSMAAGQTLSLPVEATFPVAEVAGRKKVVARFELMTDRRDVIELTTDLELGLRDVSFDATLALELDAQTRRLDAVATLLITNTGDKPLALYAFANLPGYPRQERVVPRLLPGQSTVRRFRFTDAAAKLQAADLRVGLRETAGPAVLNKVLSVQR